MNNFAEITLVQRFNIVTYYTVTINDEDALFKQFVTKHTVTNKEKLNHIMEWVKVIGTKTGAHDQYFRNESATADTRALPPIGVTRPPMFVEIDDEGMEQPTKNNLRLYCMRLNKHVVILFSGAIKTAEKAQECKQVRTHFYLANRLTKLIDEAFKAKDIQWNTEGTDIVFAEDFTLMW